MQQLTRLVEQLEKLEEKTQAESKKQEEKVTSLETQLLKLSDTIHQQARFTVDPALRFPPFDLSCPANYYQEKRPWASEPFLLHIGQCKMLLRLCVSFSTNSVSVEQVKNDLVQPDTRSKYKITILLVDQKGGYSHCTYERYINIAKVILAIILLHH